MNTFTHFILNLFLGLIWKNKGNKISLRYFAFGGILPDIPVTFVAIVSWAFLKLNDFTSREIFTIMFNGENSLYFSNKVWLFSYNILQSPTPLIIITIVMFFLVRKNKFFEKIKWLFIGMWIHVIGDLLTHNDDGALVFYPFNMDIRFHSPISYWDHSHYGSEFKTLELIFLIIVIIYIIYCFLKSKNIIK